MSKQTDPDVTQLTKEEMATKLSHYLSLAKDGRRVREKPYHDLLRYLLTLHPSSEQKIGCGINGFFVAKSEKFSSLCFHLERLDGSTEEFSYNRCLQTPRTRMLISLRRAVEDQIKIAREFFSSLTPQTTEREATYLRLALDGQILSTCPLSGMTIWELPTWEVDHAPAFVDLFDDFKRKADARYGGNAPVLVSDWADYHAEHALVRAVCAKENARQGKRIKHSEHAIPLSKILWRMGYSNVRNSLF